MIRNESAGRQATRLLLAGTILLIVGACAPTRSIEDASAHVPPAKIESPASQPEQPGPEVDRSEPSVADAGAGIATSGQVAYLDPATGKLTSEPPEGVDAIPVPVELLDSVGSFHDGLEVTTLEDGTIIATRPGGFKTAVVAVVGEDGTVKTMHVAPPAPDDGTTATEEPATEGEEVDDDR